MEALEEVEVEVVKVEVVPEVAERALEAERVDSDRALPPQVKLEAWRSAASHINHNLRHPCQLRQRHRSGCPATAVGWRWQQRRRIVVVLQPLRAGIRRAEHRHAHRALGRDRSSEQGALVRAEQAPS